MVRDLNDQVADPQRESGAVRENRARGLGVRAGQTPQPEAKELGQQLRQSEAVRPAPAAREDADAKALQENMFESLERPSPPADALSVEPEKRMLDRRTKSAPDARRFVDFYYREYVQSGSWSKQSGPRSEQSEILYWNPRLLTGADGRATVEFDLPAAAATYRLRVDAHQDGRLGSRDQEIRVRAAPAKSD
jgi:hypothetical protein